MSTFEPRDLVALPHVDSVVASPTGDYAVAAVRRLDTDAGNYISDLWRLALDGDAPPHQLTRGDSQDSAPAFAHDGRLLFLSTRATASDTSDTERTQVFCLPRLGGEPYAVTDLPLGVSAFRCARQADRIVCKTSSWPGVPQPQQRAHDDRRAKSGPSLLRYTDGRVRHWDHYLPEPRPALVVQSFDGRHSQRVEPAPGHDYREGGFTISDNGQRVAVSTNTLGADRIPDSYLDIVDLADGSRTPAGRAPSTTLDSPRFSPDGQRVYCERATRSVEGYGKLTIVSYAVDGTDFREHTAHIDRWTSLVDFDASGTHLWFAADDLGSRRLFSLPCAGGDVTPLIGPSTVGSHTGMSRVPGTDRVLGIHSSFLQPPEAFVGGEGLVPRALASLTGFTPDLAGCDVRELHTQAGDGPTIQSWVLLPAGADTPAASVPGMLWIHGGPMSQWTNSWHWRWNAYTAVAAGFAVLAPNPTGSTGFGQALVDGIWGNQWGAQCYQDLMTATDAFAALPGVDETRLVAMGGSFGGYMTNWIGANTDRFRALITHASLFDLVAFHGVTDYPAFWLLQMGGTDPYSAPDVFSRHSPRRYVDRWKTPTLVIHGEKDYRVPVGEGLALFEALQHHKVPSELIIFPDENHWIVRPNNSAAWYEAVFDFAHRWTR